jgi:sn-glycerol 3-phosphate transport system substrate-binding protein
MKKLFSVLLLLAMLFSVMPVATAQSEPIIVDIWHTRGSGANLETMVKQVETFNQTIGAEKGIQVVETYQGGYVDALAKYMSAIAAGEPPELVVLERAAGVPVMAEEGVLADMKPYVEASGMDLENFEQILLGYSYDSQGKLISLPYIRSTPVMYYNADMFEQAGIQPPTTIDELVEAGKKLHQVDEKGETTVWGFELHNDPAWFLQNWLVQLGSNMFSEDGLSVPALDDGTLLKVFTAWRSWIDEGWCAPFVSTNATTVMQEMFFNGKLAMFFQSTGSMANIIKQSTANSINVGVAFLPTWDKPAAPTGGGNIAMVERGNDKAHLDAAWEFVNFLMSDEQVAFNSVNSGYLPTTKTSVQTDIIKNKWEENPQFKVAFEQLSIAQEIPYSPYKSDVETAWRQVCSLLIQDRSINAEEAVQMLKDEVATILP